MGSVQKWKPEEIDYLQDKWGIMSVKTIAKNLGRSNDAVILKAQRLGLQSSRNAVDGILINQLAKTLGIDHKTVVNWIEKYQFPAKTKTPVMTRSYRYVSVDDFWKWAERYRHLIDFSKVEINVLGKEPSWVKKAREIDFKNVSKKKSLKKIPWTPGEENRLKQLLKTYRYTYPDLARILGRTEAAIKRKIQSLGLKHRPIAIKKEFWTKRQEDIAVTLYHAGYGFNTIAEKIGKSELSIRAKLDRMGVMESRAERNLSELREPTAEIKQLAFLLGKARANGNANPEVIKNCLEAVRNGKLDLERVV